MSKDIRIFGQDSKLSLGDFIDNYFDWNEQMIAEALGKLFYDRSLEDFDKNKLHQEGKIPYGKMNPWDKHDPSRYGVDFYKMLGYQMVLKCKATSEEMGLVSDNGSHNWKEFLVIMFGSEVRKIIENPRAYGFA